MDFGDLIKVGAILALITGCGSVPRDRTADNPLALAPASMSPPSYDDKNPQIDPTYMRTQADYHFTLAEALSLDGKGQKAVDEFKLTLLYDNEATEVRLRLASEYARMGLMTEAVEQAETAVKQKPDSIPAHLLLGGLYATLKVDEKAVEQYDEVSAMDPKNIDAPTYKAALLAEAKKFDESIAIFKDLAGRKDNPNRHQSYYYEGRVLIEKGEAEWPQAEKAFQQSIRLKPGWPEPVLGLAQIYRSKNQIKPMLTLLRSFQEKYGPNQDVAQALADYYLEKENFDEALTQLQILEDFEHDNLNIKVKIALIEIEKKQYQKAAVLLEDVLRQAPDSDKIRFYLAAVYEELEQKEKAITNYKMVVPTSQYFADAVIHAGFLIKAKDLEGARQWTEDALQKRKDQPQIYAFYASLLDEQKDYDTAIRSLSAAVVQFPNQAQLRFFLGSMYDRLGQTEKSVAEMKRVLDIDQNHVQALNFLAYTYAEQNKDLDSAEDMAKKALALQPNDGFILDTMGWVLFKKGNYTESVRYLESAYHKNSTESVIAEHLGDVYYRLQLVEKARVMYRRAMENEQDVKKIREIQNKMAALDYPKQDPTRYPASEP